MPRSSRPLPELVDLAIEGHRRSVGQLLTLAERGGSDADALTRAVEPLARGAHVVGVTGAPGAGKSTMVARLVAAWVETGHRPAVVAVDPSSPLSGGAILGDRVRMAAIDDVAFVRSVATRGHAGGLALSIPASVRVLDAAGYDPIIIETVGVGQVEVDITSAADTALVVVTPGMGDAVQANKAGLLEVADGFAVNKADQPGAAHVRRDLELMLDLSHLTGQEADGRRPPITMVDSLVGEGISELIVALAEHAAHLDATGERRTRRSRRIGFELRNRLELAASSRVASQLGQTGAPLIDAVLAGETSIVDAQNELRNELFSR